MLANLTHYSLIERHQQKQDMNRILIAREELQEDGICILAGRRAAHIADVLHPVEGQKVKIGIIGGPCGTGIIQHIGPEHVTLNCELEETNDVPERIDLLLAMPRPKVMKRLWAPIASFGPGRILITSAGKVEKNYFATHWLAPEFYRPLLVEGLEQSGRTAMPSVSIHKQLKPLLEDELAGWPVKLFAHPASPQRMIETNIPPHGRILLAIGPEGGWTEYERELFQSLGFLPVSLGTAALRSDVACISALAVLSEVMARQRNILNT